MRRVPIIAAALLLAGCSPPAQQHAPSPRAAPESVARAPDADRVAAHPDLVRRDGDTLVLMSGGKDVARLSGGWAFYGVEHLQSANGVDNYALVGRDLSGNSGAYVFVNGDADTTWFSSRPQVSPGGQYIVAANAGGAMVVTDWATAYPHTVYDFGPDCHFLGWTSDREGQARCVYPGGRATSATIALYDDTWRLSDDQEIDPNADGIVPVPGSHLKKRAEKVKGTPDPATDAAPLKALGFERLSQ